MTEYQWWQIGIQAFGVLVTLALAAVAIWGEALRRRWAGPKLRVWLYDPLGEPMPITGGNRSRWYHLRVENQRPGTIASNVRVVLTKVARPAPDGHLEPRELSMPIPMNWQHGHSAPENPSVGPARNADLGAIVETQPFQLTLSFTPNNLDPYVRAGERIMAQFMALADDAQSNRIWVEVKWDGVWASDTDEMAKHLVVRQARYAKRARFRLPAPRTRSE